MSEWQGIGGPALGRTRKMAAEAPGRAYPHSFQPSVPRTHSELGDPSTPEQQSHRPNDCAAKSEYRQHKRALASVALTQTGKDLGALLKQVNNGIKAEPLSRPVIKATRRSKRCKQPQRSNGWRDCGIQLASRDQRAGSRCETGRTTAHR